MGNGTVRDLTLDANTVYKHPTTKQCNYSVSVINNLTSSSTTAALSAAQGKVLNDKITSAMPNQEVRLYSTSLSTTTSTDTSWPYNFVTSGITASIVANYNILRLRIKVTAWTIFDDTSSYFRINCGSSHNDATLISVSVNKKSEAVNKWFEVKFTRLGFYDSKYSYNPINWSDYGNFPIVDIGRTGWQFSFLGGYGKFSIELYGSNF